MKEAETLEDALRQVESSLLEETYFRFWDGMEVLREKSGSLSEKRTELLEWRDKCDTAKLAGQYLETAEERMKANDLSWAGYNYRKAGLLLEQSLCYDTIIFNHETGDYSIPEKEDGWFTVAVDFHY
ncbi:MAG: hypothetical protein LBT24_05265 [Tannerella sp.]|nr:hypothetical protein [Tannerella sp.]